MDELPIIQKTYDLIKWYVPILNRLPKNHKFLLGDRIITGLYDFLEGLVYAKYTQEKIGKLQLLNAQLALLRHQSRLLLDFELISIKRYEYIGSLLTEIGMDLGGWLKQQRKRQVSQ